MAILAIDTSTKSCVLGVREKGQTWVDETILGRTHSEEILPRIDALLASAGVKKSSLTSLVYGQGPGSFTGLRIGVGVVQGLAYGLDIPVVGISSLACLAQQKLAGSSAHKNVMVALAARNTEVYFGAYKAAATGVELIGSEGVFEASEIPAQNAQGGWSGIGDGWQFEQDLIKASGVLVEHIQIEALPRAHDLLALGEIALSSGRQLTAFEALPEYLREQVAAKPSKQIV